MTEALQMVNRRIDAARRLVRRDPASALAAAEEATQLSDSLADSAELPPGTRSDLRARAWAYRGNVLRVTGDLAAANGAFDRSARSADEGASALVSARRLDLLASLRFAQHRRDEAWELLETALGRYRELEVSHPLGRALLKKAHFLVADEQGEEVIPLLREALDTIPPHRDPDSFCLAVVGLIYALDRFGYSGAATELLASLKRFRHQAGDEEEVLRLRWIETRLLRSVGGERRAESALLALQEEFLSAALPFEAARASLALAELYLDQGRHFDLRRLSLTLFPLFQNLQLSREPMAALILFRERLATGPLDRQLIRDLDDYFDRARREPTIRFEPRQTLLAPTG